MEKPKKRDKQIVFKLYEEEYEEIEEKRGNFSRSFYIRNKVFNSGLDDETKKVMKLIFDEAWDNLSASKQKMLVHKYGSEIKTVLEVLV
jgi:hypothetical protein